MKILTPADLSHQNITSAGGGGENRSSRTATEIV